MSTTTQFSLENSNRILLLKDKESMLADDYYNVDQNAKKNYHQIVNEWVKIIEEEKILGAFTLPDSLVSTYIKGKLRDRKVTQGNIDQVDDYLDKKYKDSRFATNNKGRELPAYDNQSPPGIEYFESIGSEFLSEDKINKLSSAEQQQYFLTIKEKATRWKKAINDQLAINEERAEERGIPLEYKSSATKPPEWFWGESDTLEELGQWVEESGILHKYLKDAYDLCKKFKPTDQVDKTAAGLFREYRTNEWTNQCRLSVVAIEKLKQQWLKVVDEKNRETMRGWLKIGVDKYENFGSHAAGVLNAVPTGESRLKVGKDGELYSVPLDRPFSKEIVGDNTKAKLVVEANDIIQGCKAEQAINVWTKQTHCDVIITDPTDFMRKHLKDPNVRVIGGPQN